MAVAALAIGGLSARYVSRHPAEPSEPAQETRPTAARDGSPGWSPDSKRLAFYSERDGNAEIYVMNADGSGQTRLTTTKAGYDGAALNRRIRCRDSL